MSDDKFPERLRQARSNAGFKSPREAAQRFGWNENTYKSREGGIRGIPDQEQVRRYARAFRVPFLWLLTGQGELVDTAPTVAIVGKIGANAQPDAIAFAHEGGGYAFDYSAPVPPNFSEGTRALEVEGDSMRNIARDGWLIYYDDDEVQEPPGDNLFGELCIAGSKTTVFSSRNCSPAWVTASTTWKAQTPQRSVMSWSARPPE